MDNFNEVKSIISKMSEVERRAIYYWLAESYSDSLTGISKTEGICGGRARIRNMRFAVWRIEQMKRFGKTNKDILFSYSQLTEEDLLNADAYTITHKAEIDKDIEDNESED